MCEEQVTPLQVSFFLNFQMSFYRIATQEIYLALHALVNARSNDNQPKMNFYYSNLIMEMVICAVTMHVKGFPGINLLHLDLGDVAFEIRV